MTTLDLHTHSTHSDDGEFTPTQIVEMCAKKGVDTFALTDHNSVRGLNEAVKAANKAGIKLIQGVELDCTYKNVNLHILGYWFHGEPMASTFEKIEEDILIQEKPASLKRLEIIESLGIFVDRDKLFKLSKNGIATVEMMAEVALQDVRNIGNPLFKEYRAGGKRSDNPFVNFYWDMCAQGKPAYVKVNYIDLKTAIETITQSGGTPVLAHPGNNVFENETLLNEIMECGVVGIEAFSNYHNESQTKFYLQYAKDKNIAVSCGSDFHGKTKPTISIGSVGCPGKESQILNGLINKKFYL